MGPEIAVVVPTYRRPDALRKLLCTLAHQTLDPVRWELVVVDNGSHDSTVDAVIDELPELVPCSTQALHIETNRGPAAARNKGWQAARAPVVAYLDDDVEPETDWLASGLAAMADPKVGVTQGRTRAPDEIDVHRDWLPVWSWWHVLDSPSPFFEACNIFYRRAALEHTGGFDEALQWWGEDTAAGWRVLDAGWRRAFAHDAIVVHPVEYRGLAWHLRNGWREQNNIALAARHPEFRREAFWRPWAFRKRDAAFVLAAAALVASVRWRPAILGAMPYLWIGRPGRGHKTPRIWMETIAVDAVRSASHLVGALRHRIFVV